MATKKKRATPPRSGAAARTKQSRTKQSKVASVDISQPVKEELTEMQTDAEMREGTGSRRKRPGARAVVHSGLMPGESPRGDSGTRRTAEKPQPRSDTSRRVAKKGSAKKGVSKKGAAREKRKQPYVPPPTGLKVGDEGAQVKRLQDYLARFGYLQSSTQATSDVSGAAFESASRTGVFDESTLQALKQYQAFHKLPVTGKLDAATREMMSRPRCGFPDILPVAAGESDFVLQGNRWIKTGLTYAIDNFTGDLTNNQVRVAIRQARRLWSDVTPLTFTEVASILPADIHIRFAAGFHGLGCNPFDGTGDVLAHAFFPPPNGGLSGDVHFDEDETWSVALPVPANSTDIVSVAAHEFGHSLGLRHSNIDGSLMLSSLPRGSHRRSLHADDVAGIQFLYGGEREWYGWYALDGDLTSAPAACSWGAHRIDCFARATNNRMYHKWWGGSSWSAWEDLGGDLRSAPAAVSRAANRIDCFARATNNAAYHNKWNGSVWSGWKDLGGSFNSDLTVSSWGANRLDVFGRGEDNKLRHKWWNGSSWSNWESLGGTLTSAPAAVSWGPNRIDVFARATDNSLHHLWWDGSSWSGWQSLGGNLTSAPAVCSWGANRLDVFVRALDNSMYHKWWNGSSWSNWEGLGGNLTAAPAATSWATGRIDCFARATDHSLYHMWFT